MIKLPYLLEWTPASNKNRSRLEAWGMLGSEVNKRRVLNKYELPSMAHKLLVVCTVPTYTASYKVRTVTVTPFVGHLPSNQTFIGKLPATIGAWVIIG